VDRQSHQFATVPNPQTLLSHCFKPQRQRQQLQKKAVAKKTKKIRKRPKNGDARLRVSCSGQGPARPAVLWTEKHRKPGPLTRARWLLIRQALLGKICPAFWPRFYTTFFRSCHQTREKRNGGGGAPGPGRNFNFFPTPSPRALQPYIQMRAKALTFRRHMALFSWPKGKHHCSGQIMLAVADAQRCPWAYQEFSWPAKPRIPLGFFLLGLSRGWMNRPASRRGIFPRRFTNRRKDWWKHRTRRPGKLGNPARLGPLWHGSWPDGPPG